MKASFGRGRPVRGVLSTQEAPWDSEFAHACALCFNGVRFKGKRSYVVMALAVCTTWDLCIIPFDEHFALSSGKTSLLNVFTRGFFTQV